MLDDLKYIHERDAQDTLGIAEQQYEQLVHPIDIRGATSFAAIENVVYAGMGGSALAASMVATWPTLPVPLELVRDYQAPAYTNKKTLVVLASYSGNTEETLAVLAQAEAKRAQIAIISGGGTLQKIAEEKGYLFVKLPKTAQPRFATLANFRALLDVLATAGIIDRSSYTDDIQQAASFIQRAVTTWRPDIASKNNTAKQIALELMGKSVVIYAGTPLFPAAHKWKISLNENAKQIAWTNQYPEFNHNEFSGWTKQPVEKLYAVVELRSSLDHPQVIKRFEVSERMLSGMRPAPVIVRVEGDTQLEQLLWAVVLGDFVGIYVGLLNGLNPAPLELVDKLKDALR